MTQRWIPQPVPAPPCKRARLPHTSSAQPAPLLAHSCGALPSGSAHGSNPVRPSASTPVQLAPPVGPTMSSHWIKPCTAKWAKTQWQNAGRGPPHRHGVQAQAQHAAVQVVVGGRECGGQLQRGPHLNVVAQPQQPAAKGGEVMGQGHQQGQSEMHQKLRFLCVAM